MCVVTAWKEGGRKGKKEREREGWREGGNEGGREREREGREGGKRGY